MLRAPRPWRAGPTTAGRSARERIRRWVRTPALAQALDRLQGRSELDRPAELLGAAGRAVSRSGAADLLRGLPVGHPAHPAVVQIPIGSWTTACLVDLLPGQERTARAMTAVGLAAVPFAALTGLPDLTGVDQPRRRVAAFHAGANLTATTAFAASLALRTRGQIALGRTLAWAGLSVATVAGVVGGHLAYRLGVGTDHASAFRYRLTTTWTDVAALEDLPVHTVVRRELDGLPIVLVNMDWSVTAYADVCPHRGAPLHDGTVEPGESGYVVRCPWHGSRFGLDGSVVSGPATCDLVTLRTRVVNGRVLVAAGR